MNFASVLTWLFRSVIMHVLDNDRLATLKLGYLYRVTAGRGYKTLDFCLSLNRFVSLASVVSDII